MTRSLLAAALFVLPVLLPLAPPAAIGRAAEPAAIPADFATFQRDVSPHITPRRPIDPKRYRQIEPALHHLALQHAERLAAMSAADRAAALGALGDFIDTARDAAADRPVLAPDRTVIGLLDPDRGLDPKEITAIAAAYGCTPTVFKKDADDETIAGVATAFLAAVRDAAAAEQPATIVVLGHGLPTEIQSYSIRFERLADALVEGAARRSSPRASAVPTDDGAGRTVDFGHLVLICDDCFSADFIIHLYGAIEDTCRDRGLAVAALPACIAGTNRDRVGFVDVSATFVPHFWKDVIELYFIRRPRPKQVTLRNFFENVDHMMYGYGRAPIVEGTEVKGWRMIDPALVQDPVTFVPLDREALAALRAILGLPAEAPLPGWLDIG